MIVSTEHMNRPIQVTDYAEELGNASSASRGPSRHHQCLRRDGEKLASGPLIQPILYLPPGYGIRTAHPIIFVVNSLSTPSQFTSCDT
jgi:hypothetical protein